MSLDGAYLERVVVNLMGAAGESEVFLDDLEIKPVPRDVLAEATKPKTSDKSVDGPPRRWKRPQVTSAPARGACGSIGTCSKSGGADGNFHPWIPTAIDATRGVAIEITTGRL